MEPVLEDVVEFCDSREIDRVDELFPSTCGRRVT